MRKMWFERSCWNGLRGCIGEADSLGASSIKSEGALLSSFRSPRVIDYICRHMYCLASAPDMFMIIRLQTKQAVQGRMVDPQVIWERSMIDTLISAAH